MLPKNLAAQAEPLEELIASGRLREISGIGEAIAGVIERLHLTGSHPSLDKMRKEVPEGILDMLAIPDLRADKAMKLFREHGIASLPKLEAALSNEALWRQKGLGAALQRKIKQGLQIKHEAERARHVHRAAELLEAARASLLRASPALKQVIAAGDSRRGCELVSDLSFVALTLQLEEPGEIFGSTELTVYLTDEKRLGITFLRATGSPAHLDQLAAFAQSQGCSLTPDGLRKGKKLIAKTEEAIYGALGLQFIEPEYGVAVEINANPWRLDLDWCWHQHALELGCNVRWGVSMARKGGIPADRILNCLDLRSFTAWLEKRRLRRRKVGRVKAS